MGVDEPTLPSPGIWLTKDELRGQDMEEEMAPEITTRSNYKSAEEHAEDLESTFIEERDMGMVEGPFTAEEAAAVCGCRPEDLRPGPMGAVEEADKIRTIFDGSVCNQNLHIRKNTAEKTTAPMVHDAFHALHWLREASEVKLSENGWFAPDEWIFS